RARPRLVRSRDARARPRRDRSVLRGPPDDAPGSLSVHAPRGDADASRETRLRGAFTEAPAPAAWAAAAFAGGILLAALRVSAPSIALASLAAACVLAALLVRVRPLARAAVLLFVAVAGFLRGRDAAVLPAERTARLVSAESETLVTLTAIVDAPWGASGS